MSSEEKRVVIDRAVRDETANQRAAESKIGPADVAECRARMAALTAPGGVLDEDGNEWVVPAAVTRALLGVDE